ncbi:MAG: hypothetical protein ACLRVN_05515 [Butyricicoccus sp.]
MTPDTIFTGHAAQSVGGALPLNSHIDPALYRKYDVKRGLRDINGQGVLAGLTSISAISARR